MGAREATSSAAVPASTAPTTAMRWVPRDRRYAMAAPISAGIDVGSAVPVEQPPSPPGHVPRKLNARTR